LVLKNNVYLKTPYFTAGNARNATPSSCRVVQFPSLDCADVDNSGNVPIAKTVTSIGGGLYECDILTSISFETGSQLASIANYQFARTGLTTISIPASVTSIGYVAFDGCSSLTSVNFESGSQLTSIGNYAFHNTGLNIITIPASVTGIYSTAFTSSSTFTINVEYGNTMNPSISSVCSSGSCYGGTSVTVVEVGECPSLGLYQYYLYAADCDTISTSFTPSYAWDFRVNSSSGVIDSISGLTSTYVHGLTSSMTMGAYFAGGGNSDSNANYIDLEDLK